MNKFIRLSTFMCLFLLFPAHSFSADLSPSFFDPSSVLTLKNQLRVIGFLTMISLIPFGIMMMTSFLRISIVFQFLRQALGSSQVPSNQIIIGLSLILTGFVMQPVMHQIYTQAIIPYISGDFLKTPEVQSRTQNEENLLLQNAWTPLQSFLTKYVREKDLFLFLNITHDHLQKAEETEDLNSTESEHEYDLEKAPWYCIIPAFMLSELRTAFMMGFLLFIPFLIIDMVIAAVLMSMGMMMLPPIMVSTPFKLLLFIMIDGWHLIVQQVISGFHTTH